MKGKSILEDFKALGIRAKYDNDDSRQQVEICRIWTGKVFH